jgi:hypothetical protein
MEGGSQGLEQQSEFMTPEMKEELRLARRCFTQIERLSTLMASYPPGHPTVEGAITGLREAFYEFFEVTDRLTVQVHPHWMDLYGSGQAVWETKEPKDYCFALSRDGVYLIHILAGVDNTEVQRFVQVLNDLVDQRNLDTDAVTLLFEAGFRYISWDAIDESLAQLAGVDSDMRNRDTREEQEMIDDLFNDAFDKNLSDEVSAEESFDADFEIRLEKRSQRQVQIEVGSRHFLDLSDEAREHLQALRRGFTEHGELEHRQGEVLSALLGARPKRKLRRGAVHQIGNVMGALLETNEPWEALSFLKLIHHWRDKFQPEVAGELKDTVRECFSPRRVSMLIKQVASSEKGPRRAILQMFNALGLEEASSGLVELLGWEINEEARDDILRYVQERARRDPAFLQEALPKIPGDKAGPLVEILVKAMPRSRPMLVDLIQQEMEPPVKVQMLRALRGTWTEATEIRDVLLPLVKSSHSRLRLTAAESLAEAAPQHVYRVLEPMFSSQLTKRPDEEVGELVRIFVEASGPRGVSRLQELVQRRGIVSDEEQELAITIVRSLIKSPSPPVVELLKTVAKDWLVAGKIRNTCKEIVDLLSG